MNIGCPGSSDDDLRVCFASLFGEAVQDNGNKGNL